MSESESSSQVSPSVDENIPKWHPPARRYALLVILCLSQFPPGLNSGAMFTALPFLEVDLHIPESNLTWIMNAFNLTMSSFLLIVRPCHDTSI